MISNKNVEKLENSKVRLSVTVDKDTAKTAVESLVQKYSKSAHIKGFRKGKVPASVLLKKYGESINYEASMSLIEDSLKQVYEEIEEKPLGYATPELTTETLIKDGEDFTFSVEYDVYPEITIGDYKGISIEVPEVKIDKSDIETELARLQEQNAIVKEKEDGKVTPNSIVTINYQELDEDGNAVDGTERQDFVFTVGTGYNYYKIDDDVLGMNKGEEKTIKKSYPDDYEIKDLAGSTKHIKVSVTQVKERILPEIDDELAQDISDTYETLKDLKEDISKRFTKEAEDILRSRKIEQLLDRVSENSTISPPESMIQAELNSQWRNFMNQSRMQEEQLLKLLEMQGKSKEDLFTDWRDNAVKSLKKQLIVAHLVEKEKIEVSEDDYEKGIERQAEDARMGLDEFKEYISKNRLKEYIKSDMKNDKLFDMLLASASVKKGKKISYTKLINPDPEK
ncbi:MAG: trigger factor [Spirochaetales bacterium]|nr:trigger factor [Spirochaetales bacterium]